MLRQLRLPRLRRNHADRAIDAAGKARLDRRTKRLTGRLQPGDIAVIDHIDIDRVAGDAALVATQISAVVNAAPSISGRYPNLGPEVIIKAGIPLLDNVGQDVFDKVKEGQKVRLEGETLYLDDEPVAKGERHTQETIAQAMIDARSGLATQLEAFAANTMEYMKRERELLLDGVGMPEVKTDFQDRHALIVVRGYDYRADLDVLAPYIREFRPILVGVDGGADALIEAGYTPDMIIGDMDSVSDDVLRCGAEIVVHAYPDGRAPGFKRIEKLGLAAVTFPAAATSEDIAMLLADEKGATLLVAVGTHATLVEFLDKGRAGMASTFLTRLRVGGKLVDAKGVSRLYRQQVSSLSLIFLIGAALCALGVAVAVSTVGHSYLHIFMDWWNELVFGIKRLF
jgi:uncharacterized membrane-anchored protein